MATKTGCPIIPIAISNSAQIWEAHFPKMKPAHVVVEYGAPIYPKGAFQRRTEIYRCLYPAEDSGDAGQSQI